MAKRKGISKATRFEVFKRDGFKCAYCGRSAPDVVLQVDHVHPVSKGGENEILNYVTSCVDCNAGKSDRTLDDQSVLAKQVDQLQQLNERREQLDMMIAWRKGLTTLEGETIEKVAGLWHSMTKTYTLNDFGKEVVRKLVAKYGADLVLEKMQECSSKLQLEKDGKTYTQKSVEEAFGLMELLCKTAKLYREKPYMRDVFYIRGILRRVCTWLPPEYQVAQEIEDAICDGVDPEELKQAAKCCLSWSRFSNEMLRMRGA